MATSLPEGEIAAKLPRFHLIGKLRRHSKHEFRVTVSFTRTTSRLESSFPDIPKVVIVRRLSNTRWNIGTSLSLKANNLRLPLADNLPPQPQRRGSCVCVMAPKNPFSHWTTYWEHLRP